MNILKKRVKMTSPIHSSNPFEYYTSPLPMSKSQVNLQKLEECDNALNHGDEIQFSEEERELIFKAQQQWEKEYRAKMFKNVLGGK